MGGVNITRLLVNLHMSLLLKTWSYMIDMIDSVIIPSLMIDSVIVIIMV